MRRISTPTAAQDLFGPGKHGFRNGDSASAILATRLQAEFFNAVQEELANAIEQAGEDLDEDLNSQLSAVIEGVVDRKAPVASQAEAVAGDNNAKRMTPLRVKQAMEAFGGFLPFGYFFGFTLANSVAAPNTAISVSPGVARSVDNAHSIVLSGAISGTLQSAGVWEAGDNQNKLDTGARAVGAWYHVFVIRKTLDGTADVLFSLSATAPTMPAGYEGFRRIGSIRTDGTGAIIAFTNTGDVFRWKMPTVDISVVSIASATPYVVKVPPGVQVLVKVGIQGNGGDFPYYASEVDAGSFPASMYYGVLTGSADDRGGQDHHIVTNTNGQILLKSTAAGAFNVSTLGWTEIGR